MNEIVVLRNNLGAWAGEIQGIGFLGAAKVVQFEDEVFGEVGLVTPDDPTDTGIHETEFVAGGVDGFYAGKLEVPV